MAKQMRLLFGSLLALLLLGLGANAKTKVAFVFAKSELCPTKMCLHGHFKKGTEVLLISKDSEQTCKAKIGKSFKAEYEPGAFEATELTGIKKCKLDPQSVFLAVFEKPTAKLKIFEGKDYLGEEIKAEDKSLKNDKVFAKAWKREVFHPEANKDRQAYKLKDYRALDSVGFRYDLSKKERLILMRQKFGDGSNDGVLFAQFRKTWSTVSSSFNFGRPLVFQLDKRIFILSQVTCQMSCGYLDYEIYEFNGRAFKLIANNADLST